MTTLPHHPSPADRQASEDGQILVLTVVVALALLAILGLVTDGGLILARHRELQCVADAAARAGAAQLNKASYRASNGRIAIINPAQAQAAAGAVTGATGATGAGAAQLDEASYRASNGRTATLNPTEAQAAAGRYLRTVRFIGQANIAITPTQVTIGLSEVVRPIIFSSVGIGPIRLAVHTVARPRTGIAQAQGP